MKKKATVTKKSKIFDWSFCGEVICNTIVSCCIVYLLASKPFYSIYELIISGEISALKFTLILFPILLFIQFSARLVEKINNNKKNK